jgi:transposase
MCIANLFAGPYSADAMDLRCVKCGHERVVKNGSVQGIPKHQCQACGSQFTKNTVHDYQQYPLRLKLLAVWLSLSGLSMRRISRLCQGSTQSVLNGVRDDARAHAEKPVPVGQTVILEVDEMWHYLKKSHAHSGSGKLLIGIQDSCLTGNVGIAISVPSGNWTND